MNRIRDNNMLIYGLGGETEQHPKLRQYLIFQDTIWDVSKSRV